MKLQRCVLLLIPLLLSGICEGQVRPDLASLINAENEFARMSIEQNVRAAFIHNFDDETIAFRNGEAFPGRKDWLNRKANDFYLFWWPIWADVAASGDFGFTTGPAERGGTQAEKKPTGGGYFASVWKKNADGEWKVAADIGTGVYDPAEKRTAFRSPKYVSQKGGKPLDITVERRGLLDLDHQYAADLSREGKSFQAARLSAEAWITRVGQGPLTSPSEIKSFQEKGKFSFEQAGGDIASSGDMGFTYGRVKMTADRDGKDAFVPLCYMRVWKKEDGDWKIILDVIGGG